MSQNFSCTLCGAEFISEKFLDDHLLRKHQLKGSSFMSAPHFCDEIEQQKKIVSFQYQEKTINKQVNRRKGLACKGQGKDSFLTQGVPRANPLFMDRFMNEPYIWNVSPQSKVV